MFQISNNRPTDKLIYKVDIMYIIKNLNKIYLNDPILHKMYFVVDQ